MDTALIIAIAVVVVLVLFAIVWLRGGPERRRKKAAGLRREALDHDEEATRAEVAAEERRAEADERGTAPTGSIPTRPATTETTGFRPTNTSRTIARYEGTARARCLPSPAAGTESSRQFSLYGAEAVIAHVDAGAITAPPSTTKSDSASRISAAIFGRISSTRPPHPRSTSAAGPSAMLKATAWSRSSPIL